jgi:hypothetical protein
MGVLIYACNVTSDAKDCGNIHTVILFYLLKRYNVGYLFLGHVKLPSVYCKCVITENKVFIFGECVETICGFTLQIFLDTPFCNRFVMHDTWESGKS